MAQKISDLDLGFYFTVATVGVGFCFFFILAHIFIKKLQKPPGGLILWELIPIFLIWLIDLIQISLYENDKPSITGLSCKVWGGIQVYGTWTQANYLLALCVEICIRVRMPLNQNYQKRHILYHLWCQSVSILVTLVGGLTGSYGQSAYWQCSVLEESYFQYVYIAPFYFQIPISFIICVIALKIMGGNQRYILRYAIIWFLYFWLQAVSYIFYIYTRFMNKKASQQVLDAWTGWICIGYTAVIFWRAAEVTILKKWFAKQYQTNSALKNRNLSCSLLSQSFFKDVYVEGIYETMLGLAMAFENIKLSTDPITQQSFADSNTQKIKLDDLKSNTQKSITITEYAPQIFSRIRSQYSIDTAYLVWVLKSEENINTVLENAQNKGGKGGSFFYFTSDNRFIIKSLKGGEKKVMLGKLLQGYYNQISSNQSLLSRVYGIYKIKVESKKSITVMIQGNIIDPQSEMIAIFDIKGSSKDRNSANDRLTRDTLDTGTVYKDQDFDRVMKSIQLEKWDIIKDIIKSDIKLLQWNNLMDYSLLLCIWQPNQNHNLDFWFDGPVWSVYIGIIDYLQTYTLRKELERKFKVIRNKEEEISVMNPDDYAKRFLKKIDAVIKT